MKSVKAEKGEERRGMQRDAVKAERCVKMWQRRRDAQRCGEGGETRKDAVRAERCVKMW